MRHARLVVTSLALALAASGARADDGLEMADLVPAQAVGLVEVVNAAGLRQDLLESPFWEALQKTEAAQQWRAGERYAQAQQRIEELLKRLDMTESEALRTYLGGRCALVLLPTASS